jgi:hypothetical protein
MLLHAPIILIVRALIHSREVFRFPARAVMTPCLTGLGHADMRRAKASPFAEPQGKEAQKHERGLVQSSRLERVAFVCYQRVGRCSDSKSSRLEMRGGSIGAALGVS